MAAACVARRAVRREPAREHPPASRRFRARLDAGARSRHGVELITVAAEGHAEARSLYALSLFEMAHDRKVHPAVRGLLHHEMPRGPPAGDRAAGARRRCCRCKDEVEQLLHDPDLEVRTEALLYLTRARPTSTRWRSIEQLGDFEDFSIQARDGRVPGAARPRAEPRRGAADAVARWSRRRATTGRRSAARGGAAASASCPTCSIASCASCSRTRTPEVARGGDRARSAR